jgi:hypothetical protein
MSNIKRKVSFYRLSITKYIENHEQRKITKISLSNEDVEKTFENLLENMLKIEGGRYAQEVRTSSNKYIIEIISYNKHMVFAKIGMQNASNTVALRDQKTLESEKVPMRESQLLELYTYFLIDFSTGVLAYIGINGAPKISAIQSLFNSYYTDTDKYEARISSIITRDVLKTLTKKGTISKIEFSVAIPSDDILSEVMGVGEKAYDSIRNVKEGTITYKIVAPRNRNIFSSSDKLGELMDKVKSKHGDRLKGFRVNAKDAGEGIQTYDLLEYNFTKIVSLGDGDYSKLTEEEFKVALTAIYKSNIEELLEYIR